jgi:hypothetical protein
MRTIHTLKTWPEFFAALKAGSKTFEVRINDRDFKVGDILRLTFHDPKPRFSYGGGPYPDEPDLLREITYILKGGNFGIDPEYVVMGLKETK